jgi:hypothetical protein
MDGSCRLYNAQCPASNEPDSSQIGDSLAREVFQLPDVCATIGFLIEGARTG